MSLTQIRQHAESYQGYLEAKVQLMDKMVEVTTKMLDLLQGREEELGKFSTIRQRIMDKLDQLDADFDGVKRVYIANRDSLNSMPELLKNLSELEQQAQDRFQEASRLNQVLKGQMEAALKEASKQLQQIRRGKLVNSAYEATITPREGFFFDGKK